MSDIQDDSARDGSHRKAARLLVVKTHYPQLDGLRGAAVLMVVAYHFALFHPDAQGGKGPGPWLQIAQAGWIGVDVFFVLSGFLITSILIETRAHSHYFRNFLARRFLRIWPLYYGTLFGFFIVAPAALPTVPSELQSMIDRQIWFWTYTTNWLFFLGSGFGESSGGYFWSLAVEEQFYLVWPVIVYILSNRSLLRLCVGMFAFSVLARILLIDRGVDADRVYAMTFTHLDGLAVGSALAVTLRSPESRALAVRLAPWAIAAGVVSLVGVKLWTGQLFFWTDPMALFGYAGVAAAAGGVLVYAVAKPHWVIFRRLFGQGILVRAGKISYALYVFHSPIASVIHKVMSSRPGAVEHLEYNLVFGGFAALSLAFSWLAAALSWRFFEKPILSLKSRFSYT